MILKREREGERARGAGGLVGNGGNKVYSEHMLHTLNLLERQLLPGPTEAVNQLSLWLL